MQKSSLLLSFFTPFFLTLFAQPSTEREAGQWVAEEQQYDAAREKYREALAFFQRDPNRHHKGIFEAKLGKARSWRFELQYDKALEDYEDITPLAAGIEDARLRLELDIGLGICLDSAGSDIWESNAPIVSICSAASCTQCGYPGTFGNRPL